MFDWLKATVNRVRGTTKQTLSLVANWLANALWLIDSKFLNLAKEAYGKNAIVYACLRLLSQSVPEPPLKAYQTQGTEKTALDDDHELVRLIHQPNQLMTEYEFWELTTIHCAISGRSVWWKERNNAGKIIGLWPLRPDRVGPIYASGEDTENKVIRGYSYQVPSSGSFIPIPRKDVIAFNLPDPASESGGIVEGLGPAQVIAPEISADNEATSFVGTLLANYAMPGVLLKMKRDVRDEAEAMQIKAHFRSEFGGSRRGTPGILDAETDVKEMGFNLQQLEFPGVRNNTESRICAAFGVPPVLVGVNVGLRAGGGLGGGGVVTQLRMFFTETTLMNYWRRFSDQYTSDVATEYGEGIVCEFDLSNVIALAPRRQEQLAPIKEAFVVGVVTRNEYRNVLRLPPRDDGDVYLIPGSVVETPANAEGVAAVRAAMRFLALEAGHREV